MRKDYAGGVKSFDVPFTLSADGGTISGIGNAPVVDRYNELMPVESYERDLDSFRANPIMLLQHRADWPIGVYSGVTVEPTGLHVTGHLGHGFEPADTARKQVAQRILRTFSIGFRELERGKVNRDGVYIFKRVEILECSLVSIPANAGATFVVGEGGKLLNITVAAERRRVGGAVWSANSLRLLGRVRDDVKKLELQLALNALMRRAREREAADRELDQVLAKVKITLTRLRQQQLGGGSGRAG